MTDPAEVLGLPKPAWAGEDVAMLYDMARRFMEDEIAPHYEAYERNEIVERSAWEKPAPRACCAPPCPSAMAAPGNLCA